MNPTTKTAEFPEALKDVMRAENSPRIRVVMEHWTGRDKWQKDSFLMETDSFGNQFLNTDRFAIEGYVMHASRLAKHFWARVKTGELGINPRVLFRLPENSDTQIPLGTSLQPHHMPFQPPQPM